jgi:hypothetical protein
MTNLEIAKELAAKETAVAILAHLNSTYRERNLTNRDLTEILEWACRIVIRDSLSNHNK